MSYASDPQPGRAAPPTEIDIELLGEAERLLGRVSRWRWTQCAWHLKSLVELLDLMGRDPAEAGRRSDVERWRNTARRLSLEIGSEAASRDAEGSRA